MLPRWRGAAPIQRAIEAGDTESGITIMQMDAGLDTGDMLLKASCPIHESDNSSDLHDRLIEIGQPALIQALDDIATANIHPKKQDPNQASYAHKMKKEEAKLDWKKPASIVGLQIRAFNPWPVATTVLEGIKIRIWNAETILENDDVVQPGTLVNADKTGLDIACGEGVLRVKKLQLPGSRAMSVQDLLNSKKEMFSIGKRFN